MIIYSIILICLSAICKALADTLAWHYDYFVAKFPKLKSPFWKINVTHKEVKYFASFPLDAWHIANSIGIFSWMALPFVYKSWQAWYIDYSIGGIVFIIVFNTFYNKVFK